MPVGVDGDDGRAGDGDADFVERCTVEKLGNDSPSGRERWYLLYW
jgi:hypothetical protein